MLLCVRYQGIVFYKFYSHVHKNSRYTPIYFFKDDQTFYIINQLRFLLYFFDGRRKNPISTDYRRKPVVVGEIVAGTSGVTVAIPSQSEVPNVKKRKQPAITDFFLWKNISIKSRILDQKRLFIASRVLSYDTRLRLHFFGQLIVT